MGLETKSMEMTEGTVQNSAFIFHQDYPEPLLQNL